MIAKGSAFEYVPLLEICKGLELMPVETVEKLLDEFETIGKMLTMLIKGVEKRVSG